MKSLTELAELDRLRAAGDFASFVKHLGRARGNLSEAAAMAAASRAPTRTQEVLKAAVTGAGTDSWGGELTGGYRVMVAAFLDALQHTSAFFRMLNDGALVRLPFNVRIGAVASAAGAGVVQPGEAIAVSRLDLRAATLERQKAAGMLVVSQELLDAGGTAAEALISRSLRASVGQAVDAEFIATLLAGVSATTATASPLADLATLLTAVGLTEQSRPYFVAAPDVAIRASTLEFPETGTRTFPSLGPTGGELLPGVPLLVSSGVPSGELLLVDAGSVGGASDTITVDISEHAAIQMDDAPTQTIGASGSGSPAAAVPSTGVSMWQTNSVALRCTAYFGAARLRAGGVAAIESITWGESWMPA